MESRVVGSLLACSPLGWQPVVLRTCGSAQCVMVTILSRFSLAQ